MIIAFGIISILVAILAVGSVFSYRKMAMFEIISLKEEIRKMREEHNREMMILKSDNAHMKGQYDILHDQYLDVLQKLAKK